MSSTLEDRINKACFNSKSYSAGGLNIPDIIDYIAGISKISKDQLSLLSRRELEEKCKSILTGNPKKEEKGKREEREEKEDFHKKSEKCDTRSKGVEASHSTLSPRSTHSPRSPRSPRSIKKIGDTCCNNNLEITLDLNREFERKINYLYVDEGGRGNCFFYVIIKIFIGLNIKINGSNTDDKIQYLRTICFDYVMNVLKSQSDETIILTDELNTDLRKTDRKKYSLNYTFQTSDEIALLREFYLSNKHYATDLDITTIANHFRIFLFLFNNNSKQRIIPIRITNPIYFGFIDYSNAHFRRACLLVNGEISYSYGRFEDLPDFLFKYV